MSPKIAPLALAVAVAVNLTGCMNLAPNYEQPEVALESQWSTDSWMNESLKGTESLIPRHLAWRDFFIDPYLQALIEGAIENNHDLKKASLNVQIAEQQYGIINNSKYPSATLSSSAKRNGSRGSASNNYSVGVGLSNLELDFFGRVKNYGDASLNKYLQTPEARDAAQLSIINAVAKLHFQQRIAEKIREMAKKTLESRQKSYQLTLLRFKEGLVAGTDLTAAESLVANAMSSYAQQDRSVKQTKNAIGALIGVPLSELVLPPGNDLSQQFPNNQIFADLPSDILQSRPDIRQAEYGLKAASANIGVARAALYPQITLTGNLGYAAPQLGDLFKNPARVWGFGPSLSLPIFDMGKRRADVKISELQQKIAVETYKGTVQKAFQEVADALVARETLEKQYVAEQAGLNAAARTLRLVQLQLQEGLINGLSVLDAERRGYSIRQGLLGTQLNILTNQVDLYTTMGGGLNGNVGVVSTAPFPNLSE